MPNWLRDYNINADLNSKISVAQANQIMAAAQTNFDEIFRDAFRKAGYEVVTAAGPDVLRVNSAILDLDVNAPAGQSGFSNHVHHHRGSGGADRGGALFHHQRIARPGRPTGARPSKSGRQMASNCHQPLRVPPDVQRMGEHLRQCARRIESGVAGTEGLEAHAATLIAADLANRASPRSGAEPRDRQKVLQPVQAIGNRRAAMLFDFGAGEVGLRQSRHGVVAVPRDKQYPVRHLRRHREFAVPLSCGARRSFEQMRAAEPPSCGEPGKRLLEQP